MSHLGTQITNPGETAYQTVGQTLWVWRGDEGAVGLAWDWVQLCRGVVAMADPMAVVTNLRLVGDEGEELSAYQAAQHINGIVHSLPWQQEVELALGSSAGHAGHPAAGGAMAGLSGMPSLPGLHGRLLAPGGAMTQ